MTLKHNLININVNDCASLVGDSPKTERTLKKSETIFSYPAILLIIILSAITLVLLFWTHTQRHINALMKQDLYYVKTKSYEYKIKLSKSSTILHVILEIPIQTLGEEFCTQQIRLTQPKHNPAPHTAFMLPDLTQQENTTAPKKDSHCTTQNSEPDHASRLN